MPKTIRAGREFNIKPILILIVVIGIAVYGISHMGHRAAAAGLGEPVQTEASGMTTFKREGYTVSIEYLYEYDIKALVLHTKNYPPFTILDRMAPKDLALAWGDVAAKNLDADFHWQQTGRFYLWHASYADIAKVGSEADVMLQSANCHIIAADNAVKRQISRIKMGDVVHLKGYLVSVYASKPNGKYYFWESSTTRTDTGNGACELIYVTSAEIIR